MQDPTRIFEEFRASLRDGETAGIEGLVARHPEHAAALRRLWREQLEAEAAIEGALPAARQRQERVR